MALTTSSRACTYLFGKEIMPLSPNVQLRWNEEHTLRGHAHPPDDFTEGGNLIIFGDISARVSTNHAAWRESVELRVQSYPSVAISYVFRGTDNRSQSPVLVQKAF
ncbi:hypothetical protein SprV_0301320300 [Sparganum proliferum]